MKRIFVKDGFVERVDLDPNGETPSNAYDVPVPTNVFAGFTDNGDGTFTAPETPLDELKARYLENVKQEHAKQLNELTGSATIEERDTWKTQQEAAENYLLNTNTADQEFLEDLLTPNEKSAITAAGGSLAGTMANKILSKAHITKKLIQFAGGMKRTAEEAINAAETVEALELTITALKAQEQSVLNDFLVSLGGSS